MRVVIAGGSGFVGRALCRELTQDHFEAVVLSRFLPGRGRAIPDAESRLWNPASQAHEWESVLEGAEAVINLAGENIAEGRWSPDRKDLILKSRVESTRSLVEAMARPGRKPKVFISASAVGFYGPRGDGVLDESVGPGYGFLSNVCHAWEAEALKAEQYGVRTIRLRIGVVLGKEGGALKKMLLPFQLGLGGPLGAGTQWMSWISLADLTGMILFILKEKKIKGPVNATALYAVTNKDFAMTLGRVLRRPVVLPAPAFALKIILGEMSEMLLTGQRVLPKVALDSGYRFRYPSLLAALRAII